MHATGVGKVLLAYAPAEVQHHVFEHLDRITAYATQPGLLRRQLSRVLREVYATIIEKMSLGACSVAVPIRSGTRVVASLASSAPSKSPPAASADSSSNDCRDAER